MAKVELGQEFHQDEHRQRVRLKEKECTRKDPKETLSLLSTMSSPASPYPFRPLALVGRRAVARRLIELGGAWNSAVRKKTNSPAPMGVLITCLTALALMTVWATTAPSRAQAANPQDSLEAMFHQAQEASQ